MSIEDRAGNILVSCIGLGFVATGIYAVAARRMPAWSPSRWRRAKPQIAGIALILIGVGGALFGLKLVFAGVPSGLLAWLLMGSGFISFWAGQSDTPGRDDRG